MANLQHDALINSHVNKIKNDYDFKSLPSSFMYFVLDCLFNLQPDEIINSITDNNFLKEQGLKCGHDRGIDAFYTDNNTTPPTIHLFNIKYCNTYKNLDNFFPSSEIDKILLFLSDLFGDKINQNDINNRLYSKVYEYYHEYKDLMPNFIIHISSNYYNGFEPNEKKRFETSIKQYSNFKIEYNLMKDFIDLISYKDHIPVNCKIKPIGEYHFTSFLANIQSFIGIFDARDIIRIVLNNNDIRNTPSLENYDLLKNYEIDDNAFEDNVRIYLKQKTKINKNIVNTATSDNNKLFFYFNNGITFTCDNFKCTSDSNAPIIDISNIQVVNGSQTIHSLYDAYKENSKIVSSNIKVLCRIYCTNSNDLSIRIAEYTNSQNPVKTRDLRSIDTVQILLEQGCKLHNYFYERKKNFYKNEDINYRIDSEKTGQLILSYFLGMPTEAKNKKNIIFSDKYDEIFNEKLTSEIVISLNLIYKKIESLNKTLLPRKPFLVYSTYWILYFLNKIAIFNDISLNIDSVPLICNYYQNSLNIIRYIRIIHRKKEYKSFSDLTFFKYNTIKNYYEDNINELQRFME